MEKEALKLYEIAKNSADVVVEEGRCMDALNRLRRLPVTYELLLNTRVAILLIPLTKVKNKKIKVSAKDVIKTWKQIILKNYPEKVGVVNKEIQNPKGLLKVYPKPSISKIDQERSRTSIRLVVRYKHPLPKCDNDFRNGVREVLYDCLYKVVGEAAKSIEERKKLRACDPLQVAVSVETCLYQKWGSTKQEDMEDKFRAFFYTIVDPNNSDLRKKILLGDIKATDIARLNPRDIMILGRQKPKDTNTIRKMKMIKNNATPWKAAAARTTTATCY
ncbi:hypothetical protein ACFE04_001291 [Oxalis oulophora]